MASLLPDAPSSDPNERLPSGPPDRPALGGILAAARQKRGLTLQQIADETKIPVRHLAAIERDDVAAIPGGFYRRAEVRAVARAVGIDDRLALECLARLEAPAAPAEPQPPGPTPQALVPFGLTRVAALVIVGAIALGLFVWARQASPPPGELLSTDDAAAGPDVPASRSSVTDTPHGNGRPPEVIPATFTGEAPDQVVRPARSRESFSPPAEETAPTLDTPATPTPRITGTELSIVTDPVGARVTVNGIAWGETPLTIRHLPPGTKQIRITHEGHESVQRVVRVDEGQRRSLTIRLRPR